MFVVYSALGILFAADMLVWRLSLSTQGLAGHGGLRVALHLFFLLQTASLAAIAWGVHTRSWSPPAALLILALLWHLLVLPVALAGGILGVTGAGVLALIRFFQPAPHLQAPDLAGGLSRRGFLGLALALTPPVLTAALSAIAAVQLKAFRIRRLTLSVPSLPPGLDGITIVHLSDLHVGQFTNGPVLAKVVAAANALKPDLMLFTGDLVNNSLSWLPQAIAALQELRPAPVLCEGNHDLIEDASAFVLSVKNVGLPLLINETLTLSLRGVPVQLLGLRWGAPTTAPHEDWESGIAASMRELLAQRDQAAFPILLAHHPHAWDHAGDIPLTLSGHTHGGQLMLNDTLGFGPLMYRYWSGVYTRATPAGGLHALVVNNGIGNWFPLRTHAPAELLHLTLRNS